MFKSAVVLYVLFFLFAHITWGKCKEINEEVASMKKAHQQLLSSMLSNQNTVTSELEEIYIEAELNQGHLDKKRIQEIKNNSQALKTRNQKTQKMIAKLNHASDSLLNKLANCVK